MLYSKEEYDLLNRMTHGAFDVIIGNEGSEQLYKSTLMDSKSAAFKDMYQAYFGSFKRVPLYINGSDRHIRAVAQWRLRIGH